MISEIMSILATTYGAAVGLVGSHLRPGSTRKLLCLFVIISVFNFGVLTVTGFVRKNDDFPSAAHALTGHAMLPLVAMTAGLWCGASFSEIRRRPRRAIPRLLFLVSLCFFCLSNTWTGYFGPAEIDPEQNPAHYIRFLFLHKYAVPFLIGVMLLFWLRRLMKRGRASNAKSAEPDAGR